MQYRLLLKNPDGEVVRKGLPDEDFPDLILNELLSEVPTVTPRGVVAYERGDRFRLEINNEGGEYAAYITHGRTEREAGGGVLKLGRVATLHDFRAVCLEEYIPTEITYKEAEAEAEAAREWRKLVAEIVADCIVLIVFFKWNMLGFLAFLICLVVL